MQVKCSDKFRSGSYLSFALCGAVRLLQPLGHFIDGLLLLVRRALGFGFVIQDVIYGGRMEERSYGGLLRRQEQRNGNILCGNKSSAMETFCWFI